MTVEQRNRVLLSSHWGSTLPRIEEGKLRIFFGGESAIGVTRMTEVVFGPRSDLIGWMLSSFEV